MSSESPALDKSHQRAPPLNSSTTSNTASHDITLKPSSPSASQPPLIPKPPVFYVPRNTRQILNFSHDSNTPESNAKRALLSNGPHQNAIALVGMGGAGKTTILRALGRNVDIWAKFRDGVWFIELGHDATIQKFLDQLEEIVADIFPDFLNNFIRLAAKENMRRNVINKFIDRLATKHFLIIFDDVWDLDASVYKLVDSVCTGVQEMGSACCKVLTSTRNEAIGRVPTHDVSIAVSPEGAHVETCVAIFCCYADIDRTTLSSLSPRNRQALDSIIDMCAGLPLALSVAGCAIQDVLDGSTEVCEQNAIMQYWESLKTSKRALSVAESGDRHEGLYVALESSLKMLEKKRQQQEIKVKHPPNLGRIAVREMFRSFCILQKQMCLPLDVIGKLWGATDAAVLDEVRMLSRHSIVSLVRDEGRAVIGVRVHDLVHDLSSEMADMEEGVQSWHARLVDAYRLLTNTKPESHSGLSSDSHKSSWTGECNWWDLDKRENYMNENLVRHLLGAGHISEVLNLLTDYRWIEKSNDDKERPPFQKTIAELLLVRAYVQSHEKTETGRRISRDIDIIVKTMELCMVPHCMKNRKESTFQLYGRLCGVESDEGLVERIVWSIEEYGRRPWARAGRGVLTSGGSLLKRVLELDDDAMCISMGRGDDLVVGGLVGELSVLNSRDGSVKRSLVGHGEDYRIVDVYVDQSSGLIYSCSEQGHVIIWKEYKLVRSVHAQGLKEKEWIACMKVMPSLDILVLGSGNGRLLVVDTKNGNTIRTLDAHAKTVTSLEFGDGTDVLVSASKDKTIRLWNVRDFEDKQPVLEGHDYGVNDVKLGSDGRLLVSGSTDRSVRMWDTREGKQIWKSSEEHRASVECVAFSKDGQLLYSGDRNGKICVWQVKNGGRDISFLHILRHGTMTSGSSLWIGDDSELFVLSYHHVHIWDARGVACIRHEVEEVRPFLEDVQELAISEDGKTMATWSPGPHFIEIRNVCDVAQRIDHVLSGFKVPDDHYRIKLAVSNDQKLVAYSDYGTCRVFVVDARNEVVLQTLSVVDHSDSLFPSERAIIPPFSSLKDFGDIPWVQYDLRNRGLESLRFNSDASVISASAVALATGENSTRVIKSISWKVFSAEPSDTALPSNCGASNDNKDQPPSCKPSLVAGNSITSKNIIYQQIDGKSFTIATLEHEVECAHYCLHSSRLWVTRESGGLEYIDLISENTTPIHRHEPPLPSLSQHHPPPSQNTTDHTTTAPIPNHTAEEEVYDVFISHAGTDKFTIAEPLYHLLVALGFKVFLDKAELRPGQNASQKMINAMKTAKIAVVILSPEFAARMWTLKELMCFLERFREKGERGVIIIPVFYRLTLEDCRDERTLFGVRGEDGRDVFATEGFLEWMAQQDELSMKNVLRAFQSLRRVTGIENKRGVTNGMSVEEGGKREEFVREIASAIVEAKERLDSGTAAGS